MIQTFKWGEADDLVEGYGDSDWAGDRVSRKSTSGGVIRWNGDVLKGWATKQQTIALSSAEAELYAMTRTASQVIGMIQLLGDLFPTSFRGVVRTDSSAAIGIASRKGLGRTRHIRVQYLWIQERIACKDLKVKKVDGKENISDILTKHLRREDIDKIMDAMSMELSSGRAEISLKIGQVGESPSRSGDLDYWVSTQKEKWPGSDMDKVPVESTWKSLSKNDHDRLREEVLKSSRWLRDHHKERSSLFHPLGLPQGPSQAKHVPRVRISSFVDEQKGLYDVLVDNWRESSRRTSTTSARRGWTAFVYQLPDVIKAAQH